VSFIRSARQPDAGHCHLAVCSPSCCDGVASARAHAALADCVRACRRRACAHAGVSTRGRCYLWTSGGGRGPRRPPGACCTPTQPSARSVSRCIVAASARRLSDNRSIAQRTRPYCSNRHHAWHMSSRQQTLLAACPLPCCLLCKQVTGVSYEQAVSRQLWDLFDAPFDRSEPVEAMVEMAARGGVPAR
jgi:hypothetical protein